MLSEPDLPSHTPPALETPALCGRFPFLERASGGDCSPDRLDDTEERIAHLIAHGGDWAERVARLS